MKLKHDFIINNVAGETVAVSVGGSATGFGGYIKLNETGAFIFKMLKNDVNREDIIAGIIKEYPDAKPQDAKDTVDEFITKLKEADLII